MSEDDSCLSISAAKLPRNKLMFDVPFPSQSWRLFWRVDQAALMGFTEMCLLCSPH